LTSYRDNLGTLLQDRGKYVVIKGPQVVGVFRTQSSVMKAAFRFAPRPVLVKKIVEEEPIREIDHIRTHWGICSTSLRSISLTEPQELSCPVQTSLDQKETKATKSEDPA
jgi:hypothetical protein